MENLRNLRLEVFRLIHERPNLDDDQYSYLAAILQIPKLEDKAILRAKIITNIYQCVSENRFLEIKEFLEISTRNLNLYKFRVDVINRFMSINWSEYGFKNVSNILGTDQLSRSAIRFLLDEAHIDTLHELANFFITIK